MILLVFLEVKLKIRIRASQYDRSDANYKCNVSEGSCSMQILFPKGNVAVLTNLGSDQVAQADVKLFFESVCGEVYRLRLLGDYHHSTRIAFVEFVMKLGKVYCDK
ncbi:uncharacterized protein LOC133797930 isoform X2 [Humulus lupulus]|uniref:uncharacterized protein LOC133797930 isoform X2 n=1 Tax=Humulus lupulus TaxID=3486 RepID=UPI002B41283E|nr:uncharacterized protein LOC133797930 isoform X2 [Humulus lupulus]